MKPMHTIIKKMYNNLYPIRSTHHHHITLCKPSYSFHISFFVHSYFSVRMFMFAMYGACWYIKRIIDRSYKKKILNMRLEGDGWVI